MNAFDDKRRRILLISVQNTTERSFEAAIKGKEFSTGIPKNSHRLIIDPKSIRQCVQGVNQIQLRIILLINRETPRNLLVRLRRQPKLAHHVEKRHAVPGARLHATVTLAPAPPSRHPPPHAPPSRRMRPMPEQSRPDSSPTRIRQSEQPTPPRPPRPPRPNDPIPPDREPEVS